MDNVPIVLGQYRIGKTLGIGAFGKVKCKSLYIILYDSFISRVYINANMMICIYFSGISYYHGTKSSSQDFKQRKNQTYGNGRES